MADAPVDLRLERLDRRAIELSGSEVIGCIVVRNEATRLPRLLEHHRRLGVEQFFVIDNGSTDGTLPYLLAQDDVRVWSSDLPFREAKYGAAWFDAVLREYATSHWVVIIDADELLWYPDCETVTLSDLCAGLDADGHRALGAVLLDMYSDRPLADTMLTADVDPLTLCPYFDRRWCHTVTMAAGPFGNQVGGVGWSSPAGIRGGSRGLLPQQGSAAALRHRLRPRRRAARHKPEARADSRGRPALQVRRRVRELGDRRGRTRTASCVRQ